MVLKNTLIIDGRGHLVGRLAAIVAKEILSGQNVVVVRCEQLEVSGDMNRNWRKWQDYRRKRTAVNPKWGPYHQTSPDKMFFKVLRGMMPHRTARGQAALLRVKTFVGMPAPYDTKKKVVVPAALRVLRLNQGRKYTVLGDLAHRVGWTKREVVAAIEDERKAKAAEWYAAKADLGRPLSVGVFRLTRARNETQDA
eukprot:CAMPEP_0181324962 /NCGR_PEP_ID=MMETSP1101-20121128/20655_1 /TAXON_ID=46948 /ORGANISM="Rhodomonas abbreviata, Strain Caron Lab Isolate" /LENGTH=195 /DNA_ID=CAMNT_0023433205 /DNA_START=20 /DNA_END=605 /DNA_ORIENTATION=+